VFFIFFGRHPIDFYHLTKEAKAKAKAKQGKRKREKAKAPLGTWVCSWDVHYINRII
jgi:hypothetical protein